MQAMDKNSMVTMAVKEQFGESVLKIIDLMADNTVLNNKVAALESELAVLKKEQSGKDKEADQQTEEKKGGKK